MAAEQGRHGTHNRLPAPAPPAGRAEPASPPFAPHEPGPHWTVPPALNEPTWGAPGTALRVATTPTTADLYAFQAGRLLTVREVADQLGVCTATVYKLCAASALHHIRIVDSIRVRTGDLAAFTARRSSRQGRGRCSRPVLMGTFKV